MDHHGITLFTETSAKTGDQVHDAFKKLGEKLIEKNRKLKASNTNSSNGQRRTSDFVKLNVGDPYEEENSKKKKKGGCCGK